MKTIKNIIDRVLASVCVVLFAVLTITVVWQIASRYLLRNPSAVTEELAKIIFVWLVLIAAAYIFGEKGGHMNIGLLQEKLTGKKLYVTEIIIQVCILAFSVFILIFGGMNAVLLGLSQQNSSIPLISTGQIYLALPICGIFTSFNTLFFIQDAVKNMKNKTDSEQAKGA